MSKPLIQTIDELSRSIKNLDEKVNYLNKNVENLPTKEYLDQRLDQKLKPIQDKVDSLDVKIDTIGTDLTELKEFIVPALSNIFEWTDDIHNTFVGKKQKPSVGN
jgi:peptidoglycan hydrolase CwlO-like protein